MNNRKILFISFNILNMKSRSKTKATFSKSSGKRNSRKTLFSKKSAKNKSSKRSFKKSRSKRSFRKKGSKKSNRKTTSKKTKKGIKKTRRKQKGGGLEGETELQKYERYRKQIGRHKCNYMLSWGSTKDDDGNDIKCSDVKVKIKELKEGAEKTTNTNSQQNNTSQPQTNNSPQPAPVVNNPQPIANQVVNNSPPLQPNQNGILQPTNGNAVVQQPTNNVNNVQSTPNTQ